MLIRCGQLLPPPASSTQPADDAANKTQPAKAAPFPSTPIKYIKNSSSAFKPFNSAGLPGGQRPTSPGHAFAEVLASDGPLATAVDESTDEVAKVPELFRSVLRERRFPGRAAPESLATVTTTTRVEAASHPAWARVSLPSLLPKKWMEDVKKGIKGRVTIWIVEWDGCPAWLKNGTKTLYDLWMLKRVHKVVENGVPNKELDLVVFYSASVPLVVDLETGEDVISAKPLCMRVVDGRSVRRRAEGYTQDSRGDGEVPWGGG
jgi:hypothetical protein